MNVYQKINEVKKSVDMFERDASTTGYGSYRYTSGSQILQAIKAKMEEVGLLFLPVKTEHRGYSEYYYKNKCGENKADFLVDGKLFYEWINVDEPTDRQRVEFEYYGQQNDLSKAFGSGLTYSERYLLLKSLGVPTDEDDPDKVTQDKKGANGTPAKAQTQPQAYKKPKAENSPTEPPTGKTGGNNGFEQALNHKVEIKGKGWFKLGDMSEQQLNWLEGRANDELKKLINKVFAYRMQNGEDGDIPF